MELEDFIRQQLNNEDPAERFPFREEYWEQAKTLLVLEERKAIRRKLIWWLLGACLLLLLAISAFWRQAAMASLSRSNTGSLSQSVAETQTTPNGIEPSATAAGALATGSAGPGGSVGSAAPARPGVFTRPASTAASRRSGYRSAKGPANPVPPGVKSLSELTTAGAAATTTVANPTNTQNAPEQNGQADTTSHRRLFLPSGLQRLPLIDFKQITPAIPTPEVAPILLILPAPVHHKGAAIVAGAPIYPDAPGGRQTGMTLGLYAAADLTAHWILSIGLQWRYRPVSTLAVTPTDQALRYSFGYVLEESLRQNWGVHYLEAPISVQRRWRRLHGELGLAPGMLLSASDREIRQRKIQYPAQTVVIESSYREGNKQLYSPLYIAAFTGGSIVLPRGIEAYGRCFYRPDGLRTNKEGSAGWRGHLWPELGLRLGL